MCTDIHKYHLIETDQLNRLINRLERVLEHSESDVPTKNKQAMMHYAAVAGHCAGSLRCALITLTHLVDGARLYPGTEAESRQVSSEVSVVSDSSN